MQIIAVVPKHDLATECLVGEAGVTSSVHCFRKGNLLHIYIYSISTTTRPGIVSLIQSVYRNWRPNSVSHDS